MTEELPGDWYCMSPDEQLGYTTSRHAEAVTHYTPEEHDQPECDADVGADPRTVMFGTLNPQKVTCPGCLRLMREDQ